MTFFGIFRTNQDKELESKLRFRQSRHRIQRFVQLLGQTADQYWQLSRQSYRLGDNEQFRQLAGGYLRARDTINRWERYLVKLEAVAMRRGEVEATTEFLKGMHALTGSILRGATPQDIQNMQLDMERALAKSEQQEDQLRLMMDEAGSRITGTDSFDDRVLEELAAGMSLSDTPATAAKSDANFEANFSAAMRELERSPK